MIENQIINKAIDFIFSHIDEELSVERIADFCGYSKFYLSRLFKAETGEGIYAFIKRVKIEESAWRLKVEQKRSITEISGDYGYSASNYATMFRDYFKKTPAQRKGSKACRHLRKITNRFIFALGVIFAAGLFFGAEVYA